MIIKMNGKCKKRWQEEGGDDAITAVELDEGLAKIIHGPLHEVGGGVFFREVCLPGGGALFDGVGEREYSENEIHVVDYMSDRGVQGQPSPDFVRRAFLQSVKAAIELYGRVSRMGAYWVLLGFEEDWPVGNLRFFTRTESWMECFDDLDGYLLDDVMIICPE